MKSLITTSLNYSLALLVACSITVLPQLEAVEKPLAKAAKSTANKLIAKPTKVTPVLKPVPAIAPNQYTNPCFIAPGFDESAIDVNGILLPDLNDELMSWYWLASE